MNRLRIRLRDDGTTVLLILRVIVAAAVLAELVRAQGVAPPIRVESNEVLIPVLVLDKKKLDAVRRMDIGSYSAEATDPDSHLFMDLAITGLASGDFRVFDDGKEQKIERVTPVSNSALRAELASSTLLDQSIDGDSPSRRILLREPDWPAYLIAYAQPPSPEGKCHEIKIKVNRPGSEVYARNQYCNTTHDPNDPLNGTPLGIRMAADLNSTSQGQMKLFATAIPLIGATTAAPADIVLEAPANPRILPDCTKFPEIGVLGKIYSADGTLAARFSGLVFGDLSQHGQSWPVLLPIHAAGRRGGCTLYGPRKFVTRVDLLPGEYKIQAVIREGNEFGRTEVHFTVEKREGQNLAISHIAFGRVYRQASKTPPGNRAASSARYVPLISKGYEVVPAADNRFQQGMLLNIYLEILPCQNQESAPPNNPFACAHSGCRKQSNRNGLEAG